VEIGGVDVNASNRKPDAGFDSSIHASGPHALLLL
jgi:hypothetical protein